MPRFVLLLYFFSVTGQLVYGQGKSIRLTPIDTKRVEQIGALLTEKPSGFGEPVTQRARWDKLYKSGHYAALMKEMEDFQFPEFNKADYFSLSDGSATSSARGLTMMRERARGLAKVTVAECLENKGRLIPVLERGLRDILQQKSWVSPRSDFDFINYNGKQYTIDLTSALYAHTIAQTLYMLGDKLNPELRKEAVAALYLRVFEPLMKIFEKQDTQYHSWLVGTNNWNAVCLSGVIGAALTIIPDKKERAVYAYIGEHYSQNTLAGFGDDGYCSEGVGYFNYGVGHYAMLRENLWEATNGGIDLFKIPKVKLIAQYIPKLEIINGVFPAISDSHIGAKPDSSLMNYLSRSLGLGLKPFENIELEGRVNTNRFDVFMVFPNSITRSAVRAGSAVKQESNLRSFFDKSGILISRPAPKSKAQMGVALKGGNNQEHHNHNDVGSYTVAVGNQIVAGDPGVIPYTSNIFQPEFRYTYKTVASYGHPVPLVGGKQQSPGSQAKAEVTSRSFSDKQDVLVLNIKSAYEVPALQDLERRFVYDRTDKGSLKITDSFGFSSPEVFESAWVTRAKVRELGLGKWELDLKGDKVLVTADTGGAPFEVLSEEISEGGRPYTRLAVRMKDKVQKGSITLIYSIQ